MVFMLTTIYTVAIVFSPSFAKSGNFHGMELNLDGKTCMVQYRHSLPNNNCNTLQLPNSSREGIGGGRGEIESSIKLECWKSSLYSTEDESLTSTIGFFGFPDIPLLTRWFPPLVDSQEEENTSSQEFDEWSWKTSLLFESSGLVTHLLWNDFNLKKINFS